MSLFALMGFVRPDMQNVVSGGGPQQPVEIKEPQNFWKL
jgi:hypothetical protein